MAGADGLGKNPAERLNREGGNTMHSSDEWARRRRARAEAARKKKIRKLQFLTAAVCLLVILTVTAVWLHNGTPNGANPGQNTSAGNQGGLPEGTEQTLPAETEETQPYVEIARASILATGDVLPHGPLVKAGLQGNTYSFDNFFAYIRNYVTQADFSVANLETTLAGDDNGYAYSGYPRFNCPDAMVDALKNAGFDMLLTANNHAYDTDSLGLLRTQEVIADRGLLHLGTTQTADEPHYLVQNINGIKVGMVCYTYGQIDADSGKKSVNGRTISQSVSDQINVFDYDRLDRFYAEMEELMQTMEAQGAEATVLYLHWGNEYKLKANDYQTLIAQKMCDLGVDVIVGGHPHVVEPVELLTSRSDASHRTLCIYSVGNAVSNQRSSNMDMNTGHTEDGVLFSFTFVKYSDGCVYLDDASVLPTWVYLRNNGTSKSYDILPLDKTIPDWKQAFDIGEATLKKAEESYDRTQALVGPGMEDALVYFSQSRMAREQVYHTEENGVG